MGRSVGSSDPAAGRRVGRGRVGRSGHPSRVGRCERLREGRSAGRPGRPVSYPRAWEGRSVGSQRLYTIIAHETCPLINRSKRKIPKNLLKKRRHGSEMPKVRVRNMAVQRPHTQHVPRGTLRNESPRLAGGMVGRSGRPSQDGRLRRLQGGSVGRVPRRPNLLRRAARGGSVGRVCRVGNT